MGRALQADRYLHDEASFADVMMCDVTNLLAFLSLTYQKYQWNLKVLSIQSYRSKVNILHSILMMTIMITITICKKRSVIPIGTILIKL